MLCYCSQLLRGHPKRCKGMSKYYYSPNINANVNTTSPLTSFPFPAKLNFIQDQMDAQAATGNYAKAALYGFLWFWLFGGIMVTIATSMVQYWAPTSAGAGVTLVMAFLNGNHIPNLLRFSTLITKFIGTCHLLTPCMYGPPLSSSHVATSPSQALSLPSPLACPWVLRAPWSTLEHVWPLSSPTWTSSLS